MHRSRLVVVVLGTHAFLAACSPGTEEPADGGIETDAGGAPDAGPADAGGGAADAGAPDAGPGSDGGGTDAFLAGNNRAILSGPAVGVGSEPLADLWKSVEAVGTSLPAGFELGAATVLRSRTTSTSTWLALVVRNGSSTGQCFVRAEPLSLEDASGTVLATFGRYVTGSVGRLSSGTVTDTCLFPGETGVLLTGGSAPFAGVARVRLTIEPETRTVEHHAAQIVATGYTVSGQDVTVSFRNNGTAAAEFDGAVLLMLDGEGRIVGSSLASAPTPKPVLAPGATASLVASVTWKGSATRMLVLTDFNDPP